MKLISMETISQLEIQYLRNNNNTGIEFEYALFYLLNSEKAKTDFMNLIINYHKFKDKILIIISKANISLLISNLKTNYWTNYTVFIATQVDNIGPADIVLQKIESPNLGLSVKYQNNCTLNISSKYFLSSESTAFLKKCLRCTCENYIEEMTANFGKTSNWFRKRKKSKETDMYIDKIRDKVIFDWNNKTIQERKILLSKLIHADSSINFWIVKFIDAKNGYEVEIQTNPLKYFNPESVVLNKESTSFIGFYANGVLFAKMQVKFNNGIIETAKGTKYDFEKEGVLMKIGDPFGSWNFNL